MEIIYSILFFIFGVLFGSFYNVVGLRVPKKEPFVNERSGCPNCKHSLSWYELFPVFSFIFLGGRCRKCKERISRIYPVMELFTGGMFAYAYYMIGFNLELITVLLLISLSSILIVSDITYMLIPDKILLFFLPLFIIMRIFVPLEPWWSSIAGAVAGYGIIMLIILLTNGMGGGDMKLFGLLGIVLGLSEVMLAFFLACLIGAVFGISFRLMKRIKKKQEIPFGPYILIATLITYFYGEKIISWYLNFF